MKSIVITIAKPIIQNFTFKINLKQIFENIAENLKIINQFLKKYKKIKIFEIS